jgi:hypothetical protein
MKYDNLSRTSTARVLKEAGAGAASASAIGHDASTRARTHIVLRADVRAETRELSGRGRAAAATNASVSSKPWSGSSAVTKNELSAPQE